VTDVINEVGTTTCDDNGVPYWQDTAVFVTWDDFGGFGITLIQTAQRAALVCCTTRRATQAVGSDAVTSTASGYRCW
jgi:hypothetical protein